MVALPRLKATFKACLGLFRQNMKALGRESRRGGMQKPRRSRRVRRTEPLPTMYSLQYTRRQKQLRTAENAWVRAASVSVPYACRQSGPGDSEKASLFGKWQWLGHAEEYGHMWCMCVIPFTGFSTSSTLTLWILSKHSKLQPLCLLMCPGTVPLLNPTPASFHLPQQLRAFPFLNEDIIMDGLSRELAAYFARAGVSFKVDRMADLAAKKVDWVRWRQNEDNLPHWAGAVIVVLLIQPSSAAAEWVFSSPRLRRLQVRSAAGCIQNFVETSVMLHYTHCWHNNIDVFEFTTHNN